MAAAEAPQTMADFGKCFIWIHFPKYLYEIPRDSTDLPIIFKIVPQKQAVFLVDLVMDWEISLNQFLSIFRSLLRMQT